MSTRVGVFVTHPIQYFSPLFVQLAAMPDIDLVVHYFSDHSIRGGMDKGFGVGVTWDIPLLEGYESVFLRRDADLARPKSIRIDDPEKLLREGRFDVVLFFGYSRAFERQLASTCWKLGTPTVLRGDFTDHAGVDDRGVGRPWHKRFLRDLYLRWFYRKITSFCAVGKNAVEHLRRLGVRDERIFFSPYAVNDVLLRKQRAEIDRAAVRASLGIDPSSFAVLFTGKLIPRKRPLLLMEAIERMQRRDRIHLIVCGSGELEGDMRTMADRSLGSRATFTGFVNQSQIPQFYEAADLFVLPSMSETWGLVVNEAMIFDLPCICSSGVGAVADLITPGVTGWSFTNGSVEELANALDNAVNLGHAGLEKMKPAIRERIDQYSLARAAEGVRKAITASARK
jgi:glycosyltransferase involved in cell wall biosynthesis